MIEHIQKFTDSAVFTNALKVKIAAVIPVLLFTFLGDFEIGFTIAVGAFLTYPSDIPSSLKDKIQGVFVTVLLISGANLLVNITYPYSWIFYLVLFFSCLCCLYLEEEPRLFHFQCCFRFRWHLHIWELAGK